MQLSNTTTSRSAEYESIAQTKGRKTGCINMEGEMTKVLEEGETKKYKPTNT